MSRHTEKPPRKGNQTGMLLDGNEEENVARHQRFGERGKKAQHRKMEQTALLRAGGEADVDIQTLPVGQVVQVYSRYCQVSHPTGSRRCIVRKTLSKMADTAIVVGDEVRFRDPTAAAGGEESVIEQILPRRTLLTRADSFRAGEQHPIVANARQMLIVASLVRPAVKWGLVDRMIVAAQSGGLKPIVCLNKIDLADEEMEFACGALGHYESLGIGTCQVSAVSNVGLDVVTEILKDKTTVLAGHSGVGKSSLIAAIQPGLDIRIGEVSRFTAKGRHTTTSARRYELAIGGCVIDTPGVKLFGLWGVTRENLDQYFPDVAAGSAPQWRRESYERIAASLHA